MIITIAGIKRSGSTALYNMVRLCLEAEYGEENVHITGIPQQAINLERQGKIVICKYHPFHRKLSLFSKQVFTSDRPLEEIRQSMQRFYGEGHREKRSLSSMKANLRLWMANSEHFMYGEITDHPEHCIQRIAEALKLDVDSSEILRNFEAIKPPKQGHDKRTLLFSNHITK